MGHELDTNWTRTGHGFAHELGFSDKQSRSAVDWLQKGAKVLFYDDAGLIRGGSGGIDGVWMGYASPMHIGWMGYASPCHGSWFMVMVMCTFLVC